MAHLPFEPSIAGGQVPPPYLGTGVKAFGFPLLADAGPLKTLCDQCLNIAPASAGISFKPILVARNTGLVVMEALDYLSLKATTTPWDDLGEAPQQEFLFAVPVLMKQGGLIEAGVFIPFIFVDNQGSAGREVLGFPKLLASFSLNRGFPQPAKITLHFQGRKTQGGQIENAQLVKVEAPRSAVRLPSNGIRIGRFFGPLDTLFAGSTAANFALIDKAFKTGSAFGFSTRILIDPAAPLTDAYRSIMRCTYSSTVIGSGLLRPMKVTFTPFVHLDIASTLGIKTNASGQAVSHNPYVLDFDLAVRDVTTLWKS